MVRACCSQKASLVTMIGLTTAFFFAEIVVGYATNSMALVADSFHMLSDVVSLFVGFFALKVSIFIGTPLISIFLPHFFHAITSCTENCHCGGNDYGPVHITPFLLVSVFVVSKLPFKLLRFRTKTERKTSVYVRSH